MKSNAINLQTALSCEDNMTADMGHVSERSSETKICQRILTGTWLHSLFRRSTTFTPTVEF